MEFPVDLKGVPEKLGCYGKMVCVWGGGIAGNIV